MEDSKSSNRWKKFLILMVILLAAIIFIYFSLRATAPPQTALAKPKSASQQAAKNKLGSQHSPDKSGNKQATPSTPPSSSNGASSQKMADAGPGDVMALFVLTIIFGYMSHQVYLKRTL